jgi:hypothetical protein
MSLLGLALFKYGGYMGYCSPASFYTGTESPDRDDLHQAINVMQARQFSAAGIENFLDVIDAGDLNDADAAFYKAKDCLSKGDYAVLSIAKDTWGDKAHTVIPYKVDEHPSGYSAGTKIMHIWDPNLPYDDNNAHYASSSTSNHLVINSATNWTYAPGYETYSGSGGAWCFAIPMSLVVKKSRQPMALDMVFDALMTVFVGGPGAAVSQITDDEGHRLYKTEVDIQTSRSNLETDPAKRLKGVGRWPWYAQADLRRFDKDRISATPAKKGSTRKQEFPGELYFIRRPVGSSSPLNFTISGQKYEATFSIAGNLVKIDSQAAARAKDIVKLSRAATAAQSLEIKTLGDQRDFTIKQLRTGTTGREWRSFDIKNLKSSRNIPVTIDVIGDLEAVTVSSPDREVQFDLDIQQRIKGEVTTRKVDRLSTTPGKVLRVAPKSWQMLDKTELEKIELDKEVRQQMKMQR